MNNQNKDISKLQNIINNYNNNDYNLNYEDDDNFEDDIMKYCIRKKLKEDRKYGEPKSEFFNEHLLSNQFDIEDIEKEMKFWKRLKIVENKK